MNTLEKQKERIKDLVEMDRETEAMENIVQIDKYQGEDKALTLSEHYEKLIKQKFLHESAR